MIACRKFNELAMQGKSTEGMVNAIMEKNPNVTTPPKGVLGTEDKYKTPPPKNPSGITSKTETEKS